MEGCFSLMWTFFVFGKNVSFNFYRMRTAQMNILLRTKRNLSPNILRDLRTLQNKSKLVGDTILNHYKTHEDLYGSEAERVARKFKIRLIKCIVSDKWISKETTHRLRFDVSFSDNGKEFLDKKIVEVQRFSFLQNYGKIFSGLKVRGVGKHPTFSSGERYCNAMKISKWRKVLLWTLILANIPMVAFSVHSNIVTYLTTALTFYGGNRIPVIC